MFSAEFVASPKHYLNIARFHERLVCFSKSWDTRVPHVLSGTSKDPLARYATAHRDLDVWVPQCRPLSVFKTLPEPTSVGY